MDKNILYRFFEGKTSLEEEMQIRQWTEVSPENRRILLQERKLFDAMILHVNEKTTAKQNLKYLRPFAKEFAKIAAVVLLTLGCINLYNKTIQMKNPLGMQTISVPAGQRVDMILADGTKVWLNARTQLKYPALFNGKERKMELDGEAYFEVAENRHKPFIVQTKLGTVEAIGTDFNVEAYAARENFETSLMKGSVKVKLNNTAEEVFPAPEEKTTLKDGKLEVKPIDDFSVYRWREGLICFKDEAFLSIMKNFEKYYGISIRVENQKVLKYTYTGKFRHTDGVDYALRVLQKSISFTYSRDDENQIIYVK